MKLLRPLFLALALAAAAPHRATAADCTFSLGFAALHDQIPDVVGACRTDEWHNVSSGDGLQVTTGGLLVWRKLDNWTAFTDGYHTWLNGPYGIQLRLNTTRLPWEIDYYYFNTLVPLLRGLDPVQRYQLDRLPLDHGVFWRTPLRLPGMGPVPYSQAELDQASLRLLALGLAVETRDVEDAIIQGFDVADALTATQ